jgi:hypothetical protein
MEQSKNPRRLRRDVKPQGDEDKITEFIIIIVCIIAGLWLVAKILLSFFNIPIGSIVYGILKIFIDLPQFISTLFIPIFTILIPSIYEKIHKKIREEQWYPEVIEVELKDSDKRPLERYEIEIVENLMNAKYFISGNAENKYYDYVYQLQETDAEFNLIWNNFNYFYNKRKGSSREKYWRIIVYKRILECFYQDNEEKSKYIFIDIQGNKHIVYVTPHCTQ